jgi:hypothetical protein
VASLKQRSSNPLHANSSPTVPEVAFEGQALGSHPTRAGGRLPIVRKRQAIKDKRQGPRRRRLNKSYPRFNMSAAPIRFRGTLCSPHDVYEPGRQFLRSTPFAGLRNQITEILAKRVSHLQAASLNYCASVHRPGLTSRTKHCDPSLWMISISKSCSATSNVFWIAQVLHNLGSLRYHELPARTMPERVAIGVRHMQIDIIEGGNRCRGWTLSWR